MSDNDRPRGILAPVDRDFIEGKKEYGHRQTAYDRRATIRERAYHALLDGEKLWKLPPGQRTAIFRMWEDDEDVDRGEFRDSVWLLLAFLLRGVEDAQVASVDKLLRAARRAASEAGFDTARLLERFETGDHLDISEIRHLRAEADLSESDWNGYYERVDERAPPFGRAAPDDELDEADLDEREE